MITAEHMKYLIIIACIGAINWALQAYNSQYDLVKMIIPDYEYQKYTYYAIGIAGLIALIKSLQMYGMI